MIIFIVFTLQDLNAYSAIKESRNQKGLSLGMHDHIHSITQLGLSILKVREFTAPSVFIHAEGQHQGEPVLIRSSLDPYSDIT